MWESLLKLFRIPDLKRRILFTLFMLVLFRVGAHIPVPGIDSRALADVFSQGGILGFLDMFAGGALSNFSILALGIVPYINASIIIQLLTAVIPSLEELSRSGEEGRDKIAQYTRWFAIVLALVQGFGITSWIEGMGVVLYPGWGYKITVLLTLTAGTIFLMWLGELITDLGVGNGTSLIIFAGIVARVLPQLVRTFSLIKVGEINLLYFILSLVMNVAIIAVVVAFQEAQRRIPVQYSKRVVGRKMYGGQSTHIPIRIVQGGVLPIIFASSILLFPATLAQFFQGSKVMASSRITLWGALFLTFIAIVPNIITDLTKVTTFYFGGTAILIMVGVAIETVRQLEAQLLMRHYEGFIRK